MKTFENILDAANTMNEQKLLSMPIDIEWLEGDYMLCAFPDGIFLVVTYDDQWEKLEFVAESWVKDTKKPVVYNGVEYSVPQWVKYVAIDSNGDLHGYDKKPELVLSGFPHFIFSYKSLGKHIFIVSLDNTCLRVG
jgi:hypothetical protein